MKYLLISLGFVIIATSVAGQGKLVLDSSFGTNGKMVTAGAGTNSMAIQLDGRIVIGGSALIRYNQSGSRDSSFNENGIVTNPFATSGGVINGLTLQADGNIVVAGYIIVAGIKKFAVGRYQTNGNLDSSFGMNGVSVTSFLNYLDYANCVFLQPGGKIVVGGAAQNSGTAQKFKVAIARYNNDGSLDATFGAGGKVVTDISSSEDFSAASIANISTGGFVIAASINPSGTNRFIVAKYKSSGLLDSSFSSDGIAELPLDQFYSSQSAGVVAELPDGRIFAAGSKLFTSRSGITATFSPTGVLLPSTYSSASSINTAITIQLDNKVIIVGYGSSRANPSWFDIKRNNPGGGLDASANTYLVMDGIPHAVQTTPTRIYVSGENTTLAYSAAPATVVLPLTLVKFLVTLLDGKVFCNWQTAQELNTSHFVVQRSNDGRNFENIGQIKSSGSSSSLTSSYEFVDDLSRSSEKKKTTYYRLRIFDKDGSSNYSSVQTIQFNKPSSFFVYPNPARDYINISGGRFDSVELFDLQGKSLLLMTGQAVDAQINVSRIARGVYILKIMGADKGVHVSKLFLD